MDYSIKTMVFALIISHPESVTAHFHPYISEFQYTPEYHPSRNPDCTSRWFRREFNERQFEHNKCQHFSLNQDRPWIEIKAILVRCSKIQKEIEEVFHRQPVQKCRKKVIINMKINNIGKTNTREEFILVDHVVDPVKMHKIRLRNPYVIKLRQETLLHLYGLRFQGIVNAEAKEEVINNHQANFSGCNNGLDNPTCGQMLINGEPIPFSQGFCCSCEDVSHTGSFHSAKLNYYQRDDSANSACNRSEPSANLFENPKAQLEKSRNEEQNRDVEPENARGRVTSRNISAVNGPLVEHAPPLREHQGKLLRDNSIRRESVRPLVEFSRPENADRAQTRSAKNVFFDVVPSKGGIEAYIDAVYEQAVWERAMKQKNKKDKNTFLQSPTTKLTKLEGERKFEETYGKVDNRKFLEIERNNKSVNVSGSKDHGENERNPNTSDCASTFFLTTHSSRIPKESQFSRHTEENAFSTNRRLATTTKFLTSFGFRFASPETINYGITPSMKSNDYRENVLALLSKVVSETRSSTASEEQRYKFRAPQNIADNALKGNAPIERENLSAAAIRIDNANGERGMSENANASTALAFTRLRNLFSFSGVSRLPEKLSAFTARLGDKSSRNSLESRNRSLLPATEVQGFSDDLANLHEARGSRGIYNSSEPTAIRADLKNSKYKFWKPPRLKMWKSKDAGKFRRDKNNLKHLEKSLSTGELTKKSKHILPSFERDRFRNKSFVRERRSEKKCRRRHLQTVGKNSRFSENIARDNENSQHKTQADYPLNAVHTKRNSENESLEEQVIFEPGYSYRKEVRPIDNLFLSNEGKKESNVDKRVARSNERSLKEDSEARIIYGTRENPGASAQSEVAKLNASKTQDEHRINNDLFSRITDKSNEPIAARRDRITSDIRYPAGSIGTFQRSINESFLAELANNQVSLPTSAPFKPEERLSATVGLSLSSPIMRKHNASKEVNLNKPEQTLPIRNRKKEDFRYSLLRNSGDNNVDESPSGKSEQDKKGIVELVNRIVRQYAAYTPLMPGMPTFDEVTEEAETLPLEEETTTVTQFTTALATTTRITDVAFRPSIRPLQTTLLPEGLHDEISLDSETEVTATAWETAIPKRKSQTGRHSASGKTRKMSNSTGERRKNQRRKAAKRVTSVKLADAEELEEGEDHPWYRTTGAQQIITANSSESSQITNNRRKKHRSKVDESSYFQNSCSGRTAIAPLANLTQTRSKSRESGEKRDSPVSHDYEESGKFPSVTRSTEVRARLEKRLADDYPASRESLRRNSESRDRKRNVEESIARSVELRRAANDSTYFNSDVREKDAENTGESLKNFTSLRRRNVNNGAIAKFDEGIFWRNREAASPCAPRSSDAAKIPASKDTSGPLRGRLATDRRTAAEKRVFGERAVLEIDGGFVVARKITANLSGSARTASADDFSTCRAEESTSDRGKRANTVVHGAKLMMAGDDKGDRRDLAAESIDKKTRRYSVAKQRGRENVRKINENLADIGARRVPRKKEKYSRRPRGRVYEAIRKMTEKMERKSSSTRGKGDIGDSTPAGRKKPAGDRSSANCWHRSGRRLLSNGRSVYIENDEYYDENETSGENDLTSGNKVIARGDGLGNQLDRREDRDSRKWLNAANRSASENAASTVTPKERTAGDADDVQAAEISEAPFESEVSSSVVKSTADNISVQTHFDDSENASRNSQNYEEEVDKAPLSFREKEINEDNTQGEFLYEIQPTFPTERAATLSTVINQDLSSAETFRSTKDLAQSSSKSKDEGSIKILLTGRIRVNGAFNQTPVLISFDAVPDTSSIHISTQSLTSTGLSNTIAAGEAAMINLPFNDTNAFYPLSTTERANDEANNSSDIIAGAVREAGKTNTSQVTINSREKFFHLVRRRREKRREIEKANPSRIEKRLDKYNSNSRTAKQVFLTDYSKLCDKIDRTNVRRKISERLDKLENPASSTGSVPRFPNILGSVLLVNNVSVKNLNTTEKLRCRIDTSSFEANRSHSKNDRSRTRPLLRIRIEKPANIKRNRTECSPGEDTTSVGCYGMPVTVRKLQLSGTTSRELQTWSNYRDSNPVGTFLPAILDAITNQNIETAKSTSSAENTPETTSGHETLFTEIPCNDYSDESSNAIRIKNMMAIVRFVMKLLRIITEEPPYSQIGETSGIPTRNVTVNVSNRSNVGKQRTVTDRIMVTSERARQDLTSVEWQSTITESIREKSLPSTDGFEPFTEAPSYPVASTFQPISCGKVFKDEGPPTSLFEPTTRKEVRVSASSSTSPAMPKSFLFYESVRKSPCKDASRKNTNVDPTGVKQNSNVSFTDSKENSEGRRSRLDDSQTNVSSSRLRRRDQSSVDRLYFDKQTIASNSIKDKIESFRENYLSKNKSVANDTIRPILDILRDTLIQEIDTLRKDKSKRSKLTGKTRVSNRQAARTKLLDKSEGGGVSEDWIGEHRAATRQLPVDKKFRESRQVADGAKMPKKVVFWRVRGKINRSHDPNLVERNSFKIEGRIAGRDSVANLLTDDVLSISERSSSFERADSSRKAKSARYSSIDDNVDVSKIDEEMTDKRMSATGKKRDFGKRRDFQKDNRIFKKRQKIPSPTKKKRKWQKKKKKRKKGAQRTKDISGTRKQLFKRHLLMMSPEQESAYDADDAVTLFLRRYNVKRQNAENFRKSAGGNTKRREDGSRTVDRSEVDPIRAQIRGGQDCTDRRHPPNIDTAKYLESAHCLRFSDLWYSVYQLKDPIVEHTIYLQVYEKRALANGSTYWKDLTGDSVVRLGTFNRHHRDSQGTITFSYKEVKTPRQEGKEFPNLDIARDRLLVPSSVTSKSSGCPVKETVKEESNEYLVVPASSINENGNECDKAGVGFAAFAKQPDRCGRVRGTCLKNQPLAFRRHDEETRAAGRPGCYFLSNFASVPSEPIKYSANGSGSREFLALEYHSPHVSAIDIEVKAGYNVALASGSHGRISEVHVDSTALDHTVVTTVVTNTGLTSMFYRLKITNCPDGLPESWRNVTFPKKVIPPRRDQTTSLNLYGELSISDFYCSVELQNRIGELVASRKIKIRKLDRCSCILHCLCVCVNEARGTSCRSMSPQLYHAAGFHGPVPVTTHSIFSDTNVDAILFVVSLMFLLLFMGLLKWVIGLRSPAVGRWGLDSLLEFRKMSEYLERELKCKCVVTDEHGAPVHPETWKRTVRICSRKTEFFLNATFFFIFPFAVCCYRLKKSFRIIPRHTSSDKSEISSTSDKSERSETICVSTYADNRDSQMEAEDTKYVMDELKKSEELLRCHSRSRRHRCAKECRSRH